MQRVERKAQSSTGFGKKDENAEDQDDCDDIPEPEERLAHGDRRNHAFHRIARALAFS